MKNSKKQKYLVILSALLFISLFINIYQFTSTKNHDKQREVSSISSMLKYIEEASSKGFILLDTYSEISNLKKLESTLRIRSLIDRSVDYSSMSGKFFPVLKHYSSEYASISHQIIAGEDPDLETLQKLYDDLVLMEDFLYDIDIWYVSQEELFNSWKKIEERLNTESLKGILGQ